MEEKILLSVIVVSYNNGKFLEECFDSILSQNTNFEYEVIVGDDGSSDNSLEIIKKYEKKFKNFSCFIQDRPSNLKRKDIIPSIRASNVIFRAMKMARGKYINILSSDDYYIDDNYFSNGVNFLEDNKKFSAYVTSFYFTFPDGTMNPNELINPRGLEFWADHYIHISCYIFRKLPEKILPKFICDDDTLSLPIGLYGNMEYTSDYSLAYRMHKKSIMQTQTACENDLLHMLMLQESLNIRPTSIRQIPRFVKLYILSCGRYAPYYFSTRRQREKYMKQPCFKKYADVSRKYPTDIIGRIATKSIKNTLFLKTISLFTLFHEKYYYLLYPVEKRLLPAEPSPIPTYKISKGKINYRIERWKKQADGLFIGGWCYYANIYCDIFIKTDKSFYPVKSVGRPEIKEAFSLPYLNYGFICKIPEYINHFELYLVDHKNESIYVQHIDKDHILLQQKETDRQ